MRQLTKFVQNYRKALLAVLLGVILVNFYFYIPLREGIKVYVKDLGLYELAFQRLISERTYNIILVDGGTFFALSLVNTMLSAAVVAVFFRVEWRIVKVGILLLGLYFGLTAFICFFSYLMSWNEVFVASRIAMEILPSPLIEASLIPILKLYEQSFSPTA